MRLSENILENILDDTREFMSSIAGCKHGDQSQTLKMDVPLFVDLVVYHTVLPILVTITGSIVSSKITDSNKPLKELAAELKALTGKTIAQIDKHKRDELIDIVEKKVSKYGASREQAQELVDMVIEKLR